MSVTLAFDATHLFIGQLPAGHQACGYDTGSDGIAWTAADWKAHPGAVHIDQDTAASRFTSDVLDVERGAATIAEAPGWVKKAQASYAAATRPGQRTPAVYIQASNVTPLVNALTAAKVTCGLWIASWGIGEVAAVTGVLAAAGPYPVIGVQFTDNGSFDSDVFSTAWLTNVSGKPKPGPLPPDWHYAPCRNLTVRAGTESVAAQWNAPDGEPGMPAIGGYRVTVRYAAGPLRGYDVPGYPRWTAKGRNPQQFFGGSLPESSNLVFAVQARRDNTAATDSHAGPWATAAFRTG